MLVSDQLEIVKSQKCKLVRQNCKLFIQNCKLVRQNAIWQVKNASWQANSSWCNELALLPGTGPAVPARVMAGAQVVLLGEAGPVVPPGLGTEDGLVMMVVSIFTVQVSR